MASMNAEAKDLDYFGNEYLEGVKLEREKRRFCNFLFEN